MKKNLMKIQSLLVYAIQTVSVSLFVLYLGFMTHYYVLFYDGTFEMFEYYKKLQIFNKQGFNIVIGFVVITIFLLVFELHKIRPGLFALAYSLAATGYIAANSFSLINVIPKYKEAYLALDFTTMEDYVPSTFTFDAGLFLHYILVGLLAVFSVLAILTFIERIKEGNPLIRKLL